MHFYGKDAIRWAKAYAAVNDSGSNESRGGQNYKVNYIRKLAIEIQK